MNRTPKSCPNCRKGGAVAAIFLCKLHGIFRWHCLHCGHAWDRDAQEEQSR